MKNEISENFYDVLRHEEYKDSVLYEAFRTGWGTADKMKIPEPPRRIFDEEIPDRVIREYYQLGHKRGYDYKYSGF